jgi:hypothetical protein
MECFVRLVVVRRQGLLSLLKKYVAWVFPFTDLYVTELTFHCSEAALQFAENTTLMFLRIFYIVHKYSVRTSQEKTYVSATKTNLLILFTDTAAVYCENQTKFTNTLCGQNDEF